MPGIARAAAAGSAASQTTRTVELSLGALLTARYSADELLNSRRQQELAMCVDSWRSRDSILAGGRLATIVSKKGHWRGLYGPLEGAARTRRSELRFRTTGGVNDRCVCCE